MKEAHPDARALRTAVAVLRAHSRRPSSVMLRVICNVLEDTASRIDIEAAARESA